MTVRTQTRTKGSLFNEPVLVVPMGQNQEVIATMRAASLRDARILLPDGSVFAQGHLQFVRTTNEGHPTRTLMFYSRSGGEPIVVNEEPLGARE